MNPKDYEPSGFKIEQPEEKPKPELLYKEGETLYGLREDGSEFCGRVDTACGPWVEDGPNTYALIRGESYWGGGEREWFEENQVSRLSLADRVRFIEDQLGIKH